MTGFGFGFVSLEALKMPRRCDWAPEMKRSSLAGCHTGRMLVCRSQPCLKCNASLCCTMNTGVPGPADPPPPWPTTLALPCRSWLCNASLCCTMNTGVTGPVDPPRPPWPMTLALPCRSWGLCSASLCCTINPPYCLKRNEWSSVYLNMAQSLELLTLKTAIRSREPVRMWLPVSGEKKAELTDFSCEIFMMGVSLQVLPNDRISQTATCLKSFTCIIIRTQETHWMDTGLIITQY